MHIREARKQDAAGIANVHVASWQTTYRGLMAESYLANLSVEGRLRSWLWTFDNLKKDEIIYVAETGEGKIVGFSSGGRSRHDDSRYEGELYAIYLLQDFQGMGLGKRLFQQVSSSLKASGCSSMMLWVLRDNPAAAFYAAMGGRVFDRKTETIGESDLEELAVGWERM
ncbi:GNAT family N-acetyltransferase [Paenibacillus rhizovicinus]|uniref:GNAT family N-acetyltransferase n=1 Tax=Paenibacillus rhizovicinus TaxID=2704463 RepID=A0A6C0NUS1_9BACL|nr:GNAT family N-acetyltransferase [Paenibacillus rhizovicinus]QHW29937.1 GNAT family N-acetyltransferase [Paenibacillus rhizovicinus]